MDNTVYKLAVAALLHDIGKFAERAKWDMVSEDYFNRNAVLYCPYISSQNRHTHRHSVFTAKFIEQVRSYLPDDLFGKEDNYSNSFINLAASHHKPGSALQWIIAMADRISSGFDRREFEEKYNMEIEVQDYQKTRLLPLLEGICFDDTERQNSIAGYRFRYRLSEVDSKSIFPVENIGMDQHQAIREYSDLFTRFLGHFCKLRHRKDMSLWVEHLDSLLMLYTSHIPSVTVGNYIPDISLYDHSHLSAALAVAIYKYYKEINKMDDIDLIKGDYFSKKFLIISGDFYGIQDFIFSEGGETHKAAAKLLRGRSFYVSLLSELAADMICRELGLPVTSIILNAAGRFTILSHNSDNVKKTIKQVEESVNKWLIENFFGQSSMGVACVEASYDDLLNQKFYNMWREVVLSVDRRKYEKFDLLKYGGCRTNYLDSFDRDLGICPFCNIRPCEKDVLINIVNSCRICRDHKHIGENLVKARYILVLSKDASSISNEILQPIYDKYKISFITDQSDNIASDSNNLLRCWDIGLNSNERFDGISQKFINGYIPKYEKEDLCDENLNKILAKNKSDGKKEELFDNFEVGLPKTFLYIAKMSLSFDEGNQTIGFEALGVLKADIDNLGLIFSCGIDKRLFTLSRLVTLSRQINNFFVLYIPNLISSEYKNTYTVFSGGDDLFLIGPWNSMTELANDISKEFSRYVCENKNVTISTGISIHKPHEPVVNLAEKSESALSLSKKMGRNRFSIFNETMTWDKFDKIMEIKNKLQGWLDEEIINNSILYKVNEFIGLRKKEISVLGLNSVNIKDLDCLKWRSNFYYTIVRNAAKHLRKEERVNKVEEVKNILAKWIEENVGALKVALWITLYERRR